MGLFIAIAVTGAGGTISGTVGTLINAVSIDDYGAVGDGTTDDTAALIAAVATGEHVFIPKNKTYKITGTTGGAAYGAVLLASGQYIIGEDRLTSIIKVVGNGRGIQLSSNGYIGNLTFQGAGIGAGLQWNVGIIPYGIGWKIENCTFTAFSGTGVENGGGGVYCLGVSDLTDFQYGSNILHCDFISNVCGLNVQQRAEYLNISGGRVLDNTLGILNMGGNNKYSCLNILENVTGFKIITGTNDGHGVMSNCTVNHNTTNLHITDLVLGFKFVGCMFYQGHITITNSTRVAFSGCDLVGAGTLTLTSNGSIKVGAECYYPTSGGDQLTKALTGTDISIV